MELAKGKSRNSFKITMGDGSEREFIKDKEYRCIQRSNNNVVIMDESKLGVELIYEDFICCFEPIMG